MTQASHSHLRKQLKMLTEKPVAGFRVELVDDNLEKWRVWIRGPKGSPYEGGFFRALLEFPADFPFQPPSMRFESKFWHPNVYPDGRVCISILHPPGEDEFGYEQASERWTPIQSIESVLISVILMVSDPNDESPANLDAALQWRKQPSVFKERVQQCVAQSLKELPADFEPPKDFDEAPAKPEEPTRMVRDDSVASMNYEEDDMDYDDEEEEGVDPEDKRKYAEQLRQLADMGCTDTVRAIQVLKEVKGEMERALDKLFNS